MISRFIIWSSITALAYTYLGYPVLIWVLARLRRPGVRRSQIVPRVSVVIACHNEAANIESRIKNLLEIDYPVNQLDIIIVSDGSTDLTEDIAATYASARLRVISYPVRQGKAAALNLGVSASEGEIILFTDSRQWFESDAIKEIVANFADPKTGAVSGELILDSGKGSAVGESVGAYWRYEKWIRRSESRLDSVIGATGAIYGIRRELFSPLPLPTILDDVYIPMSIALRGYKVIFEERARAHDRAADSASSEFSRKVRTLAGNYQLCQLLPKLLIPNYRLVFQFYSHKLLRLAAPVILLALLITNTFLVAAGRAQFIYYCTLALQGIFYGAVFFGRKLSAGRGTMRLANVAYMFSVMNAAALVGLYYYLRGRRDLWVRGK